MIVCVEGKAAGVQGRLCASPARMSSVGGAVSVTATCWMGECPTESPLKKLICCSFSSAILIINKKKNRKSIKGYINAFNMHLSDIIRCMGLHAASINRVHYCLPFFKGVGIFPFIFVIGI